MKVFRSHPDLKKLEMKTFSMRRPELTFQDDRAYPNVGAPRIICHLIPSHLVIFQPVFQVCNWTQWSWAILGSYSFGLGLMGGVVAHLARESTQMGILVCINFWILISKWINIFCFLIRYSFKEILSFNVLIDIHFLN